MTYGSYSLAKHRIHVYTRRRSGEEETRSSLREEGQGWQLNTTSVSNNYGHFKLGISFNLGSVIPVRK